MALNSYKICNQIANKYVGTHSRRIKSTTPFGKPYDSHYLKIPSYGKDGEELIAIDIKLKIQEWSIEELYRSFSCHAYDAIP